MMQLHHAIYMCCVLSFCMSCAHVENKAETTNELGSIPENVYVQLLANCDYVDIIFYDSPVSMSQSNDAGIQNTLSFVTKDVPRHDPACKPLGRISYMIQGQIIAEGDFYCSDGCKYVLFIENRKPKYINTLSVGGVEFFENILAQIQKQVEGQ